MFQVRNICKTYHGKPILQDISFDLEKGKCIGIAGENGSGKTTLLQILAQIIHPDSGDILYRNKSVRNDRSFLRHKLGYVPQQCDLFPELTAKQQIQLWQSACGCRNPIPLTVSQTLGMNELFSIKIGEMSGGMQKRVSIAMALSTSPEILIMDEATNGLDAAYRIALLNWLEDYLHWGGRIVWVSHHSDEIQHLCNTVLKL